MGLRGSRPRGGECGRVAARLVDERASRRREPAEARAHRLHLGRVTLRLLLSDVHHLPQHRIHRLAALLEDVDERVLRARRVVVHVVRVEAEDDACSATSRRGAVVHRAHGHEAPQSSAAARLSTLSAFSISATTDSMDSRNASACALAVLPLSCVRSSAISSSLPSTRRTSICARKSRCCDSTASAM
eukprot:6497352-Prymnesium_polylepis.1